MKKICIITLYGNNNFGNKLQSYAVQSLIKNKMGFECEIIKYKEYQKDTFYKRNYRKIFNFKYLYGRFVNKIKRKKYATKIIQREKLFKDFNKYLGYRKEVIDSNDKLKDLNSTYDYFIFGSDQIWNIGAFKFYDLAFGTHFDSDKKIAFSASFGIDKIPDIYIHKYSKALKDFHSISLRENEGKQIIEKICNRKDAIVVLDPTMNISCKEWNKISKKPVGIEKKIEKYEGYILNYFLGNFKKNTKDYINKIAKKHNFKIINILDEKDDFFISGPSEFLWLEKHASLICTDSFHSCVFSILFKVPFIVFNREDGQKGKSSTNSRIDTLLNKFQFEDRYFDINKKIDYLKCDFSHVENILEKEKIRSIEYLKKSFKHRG